jgi:UDP-N-acetylglucosamine 2-epimerase (non-hydrolysing)/GDP/UDP-N,N'-diacetylbacillosamine 2-epimerase (hydrolysing)
MPPPAPTTRRKICVVTGTRADYGLWLPVLEKLRSAPDFELQLIVTGMHLANEFGRTVRVIEADGYPINRRIEMLLASDTPVAIAKSVGLATASFAEAFEQLQPDLVLLLGDRFEMLAAAQAALFVPLPIGHLFGGDTTEGAFDEAIRHSLTKMSHLHFVSNTVAAQRVRQLGENPAHIYTVGSTGIDVIKQLQLLTRDQLATDPGIVFRRRNLLITYHPVTLTPEAAEHECQELFAALTDLGPDTSLIFTKPNADTGGRRLIELLEAYVAQTPNAQAFTSLGQLRYLSVMAQVDAVVGNSSSGLYEAPSFKIPTVNIGDRQRGRLAAASVLHCAPTRQAIGTALEHAFTLDCSTVESPFGNGTAGDQILAILRALPSYADLVRKPFFDWPGITV